MKQIKIILLILLLLPVLASAQESPAQKWLHSFEGRSGITTVSITSAMFKLLSKISSSDPEYQDIVRFAAKLQDFKIVLIDSDDPKKAPAKAEFNRLLSSAPLSQFEELMSIRESDNHIVFRVMQRNNHIQELIMTISGDDQAIIFIKGDFKLNELTQISDDMNITGMDKIKKLKK
ncbi:DUF4252 domain-containing protein [Taibaiella koreensis]|uniref:DUF4252 domain-containing protein n=1 Tax=Taibaiella koreensis TaxID=1268548 RepID=UPI000E59E292|nr:DUF4252 domain-containing protein [Taibaiella koreensis]